MDNQQLKEKISTLFPTAEFQENKQLQLNITVSAENIHTVAKELKENKEFLFDYLICLSAVDFEKFFVIVYHLESTTLKHQIVLKAKIEDRQNAVIPSVSDIWIGAEFHELEAYDLMGIQFQNHVKLRRLFLDEDFVGHPLRKDFVDEVNIVEM